MPQLPTFLLPVLLTERWDASHTLPHVPPHTPLLMLSGKRDLLVPPSQMVELRRIREKNGGEVRWREFDGEHNDTFLAPGYWDEIYMWLKDMVENTSEKSS
jgi:predicted esterase